MKIMIYSLNMKKKYVNLVSLFNKLVYKNLIIEI